MQSAPVFCALLGSGIPIHLRLPPLLGRGTTQIIDTLIHPFEPVDGKTSGKLGFVECDSLILSKMRFIIEITICFFWKFTTKIVYSNYCDAFCLTQERWKWRRRGLIAFQLKASISLHSKTACLCFAALVGTYGCTLVPCGGLNPPICRSGAPSTIISLVPMIFQDEDCTCQDFLPSRNPWVFYFFLKWCSIPYPNKHEWKNMGVFGWQHSSWLSWTWRKSSK